jgi:hypothetical protein
MTYNITQIFQNKQNIPEKKEWDATMPKREISLPRNPSPAADKNTCFVVSACD